MRLGAYGGIKAADYAVPVLGLIFLQFADNKYSHYEEEIVKEYKKDKGTRLERTIDSIAIAKCGFYLPDFARYDYLLNLPGDKSMAKALSKAMKGIEDYQDEKFKDVLPKDAFFDIEKKKSDILPGLLKTFSDIPKDATGDIFGKIYEYFLGEFAMSEGQKGGEFFTPTSVVRFIVEVIEPYAGKIYDPACGSGGMFVQSAKFIQETKHDINDIFVYGQEYMGETVRLAKMNLMVNNIRGEITEVNSYENDPYKSLGKFDFVMANPPFNVKSVKETTVKNDERFTKFGLPKNKGKNTDDSITDANYLWISLFATSLNEKGRAGFVMANSASDAGNSEYDIRKQIVDSGMVDCMVSMPSNMFFTVTLPATLWFFDKQKIKTNRKDKILFIDARNTYHQINRAQREWKEEQIQNLAAIVRLYRGENERYLELVTDYARKADESIKKLPTSIDVLHKKIVTSLTNLKQYATNTKSKLTKEDQKKLEESGFIKKLNEITNSKLTLPKFSWNKEIPKTNKQLLAFGETFTEYVASLKELDTNLKKNKDAISELWTVADKVLKQKSDKSWTDLELNNLAKTLDEIQQAWKSDIEKVFYWQTNIHWLQSRFPDAKYVDVIGLCKLADKKEYATEQDYSLNAGRYVGVDLQEVIVSQEEFRIKIDSLKNSFHEISQKSLKLEKTILSNVESLI
jgi:type I restriction enzyme M protein